MRQYMTVIKLLEKILILLILIIDSSTALASGEGVKGINIGGCSLSIIGEYNLTSVTKREVVFTSLKDDLTKITVAPFSAEAINSKIYKSKKLYDISGVSFYDLFLIDDLRFDSEKTVRTIYIHDGKTGITIIGDKATLYVSNKKSSRNLLSGCKQKKISERK